MVCIRMTEIKARRSRKKKMHKLRARYTGTSSSAEKEKILEKAARLAPWLSQEAFKDLAKTMRAA